jgi:hypothetical protein
MVNTRYPGGDSFSTSCPLSLRGSMILAFAIVALLCAWGCGPRRQASGRPDIDAIPEIELRGAADKATLYEFRAKVRKRGVSAAKQDLPDILPSFEAYEKYKLGEHKETYKQIAEKLKALQGLLAGSPTKEAVVKAVDEIGTLADKLPGKANENPAVE